MSTDELRQNLLRPYKCPLCDRAFHRLEHQTRHIRTHTGEKPHACQFSGCSKRFSRSDELTRHSRIHDNFIPRCTNKAQQVAAAAAMAGLHDGPKQDIHQAQITMPPQNQGIRQVPSSNVESPNVSPPRSFAQHATSTPTHLSPYARPKYRYNIMDINLLVNAADQVAQSEHEVGAIIPYRHQQHLFSHRHEPSTGRLPSISAHAISQSMPRSHSQEHLDCDHRMKRSRPNSTPTTSPSSPTFSHESTAPTPDHTPFAAPTHSPRLRVPGSDVQLPGLRILPIGHTPLLAPVKPHADGSCIPPCHHQDVAISDIATGNQRKLPIPQLPQANMADLLDVPIGPNSGKSSSQASICGEAAR